MEFGAHLPLMDFGGNPHSLEHLIEYTRTVEQAGFSAVAVNDHMVFAVPWLDGPIALAAVLAHSGTMQLATTVVLPVIRGPVAVAKAFSAIDRLSGGRVVLGVGPGSAAADYDGTYYSTRDTELRPLPTQPDGPPIWVGSWGSEAGLRRAARLGDGWLASAYNTTPDGFAAGRERLGELLEARDRDPAAFPNAIATMWFHITEDDDEAERVFTERLLANINRPEDELRSRLPVGPPEHVAELLIAYNHAGVQRVYLWPVIAEAEQIRRFSETVAPLVAGA
jgi:alkanesulfonate monooxygenase SsuD/methylene tetrahydromethanopterin reductase-like flavin-dependent oxidoreductase (luciferase family)